MAVTSNSIAMANGELEFSTDSGSAFTDASGHTNMLTPGGGERTQESTPTFDGPISTVGQKTAFNLNIRVVYTEEAADLWQAAYDNWDDPVTNTLAFQWSPNGGAVGDEQYTSGDGEVLSNMLPPMDAGENTPILLEFTFACQAITVATISV